MERAGGGGGGGSGRGAEGTVREVTRREGSHRRRLVARQ